MTREPSITIRKTNRKRYPYQATVIPESTSRWRVGLGATPEAAIADAMQGEATITHPAPDSLKEVAL